MDGVPVGDAGDPSVDGDAAEVGDVDDQAVTDPPSDDAGDDAGTPFARLARRRKRHTGGRRPHRTVIRHTDEEYARVVAMAAHLGVGVPGLYERALLAGSVQAAVGIEEIHTEMLGVRRLLANASNNINQVTRAVNSGDGFDLARLEVSLERFEEYMERLLALLEDLPGVEH